jgi:hypothetical protein
VGAGEEEPSRPGEQRIQPGERGAHGDTPEASGLGFAPEAFFRFPTFSPAEGNNGLGLRLWSGLGERERDCCELPSGLRFELGAESFNGLWDRLRDFFRLWDWSDRFPLRGGLCGLIWGSEVQIEGDADQGIEADSDLIAVAAGSGLKGRRQSDICGHGAIIAPLSHHNVPFTPVLLGGVTKTGAGPGATSPRLGPLRTESGACTNDTASEASLQGLCTCW